MTAHEIDNLKDELGDQALDITNLAREAKIMRQEVSDLKKDLSEMQKAFVPMGEQVMEMHKILTTSRTAWSVLWGAAKGVFKAVLLGGSFAGAVAAIHFAWQQLTTAGVRP